MSKFDKSKVVIITSLDEENEVKDGKIKYYGDIDGTALHRNCLNRYCASVYNYEVSDGSSNSEPIIYLLEAGNIVFLHVKDYVCNQGLLYVPGEISYKQRKKLDKLFSKMHEYFIEFYHVYYEGDVLLSDFASASSFDGFRSVREILDGITLDKEPVKQKKIG